MTDRISTFPALQKQRVSVLLPYPFEEPFDYAVPAGMELGVGDYVRVPLGPRETVGVVWDNRETTDSRIDSKRLKSVAGRFDAPPMPAATRRFVEWVASYTVAPTGAVLRMALSSTGGLEPPRAAVAFRIGTVPDDFKRTAARNRVLSIAQDGLARSAAEFADLAGCGLAVVRGLADTGALQAVSVPPRMPAADIDGNFPGPALAPDQQQAADALVGHVGKGFSVTLLDGVTGSGKTEVYFEMVAAALRAGKQALVLLPEIALSAQFLQRFERRFGTRPALWHSDVGSTQRRLVFRGVAEGQTKVVVGARSALFLPFPDLGAIIVDEEHESAFKQEDGVIYHARDMAIVRASIEQVPIALVSATPSLESIVNVEIGRFAKLDLPSRHAGAQKPAIELVDLRKDPPPRNRFLSKSVIEAISETLARGEQAMLFLNRRGYAPLTLCRTCGHRLKCPNCTAWLVEHRFHRILLCHHCGHTERQPEHCENCGTADSFAAVGPGIERIAEEAGALWPDARTILLASDTVGSGIGQGPAALDEAIRKVQAHEIDLVIGTQIVAKGHHFPMLTLVGVVDADLGLAGGDLRASERTYQLLHQVAGRAGRAERPGRVLVQTWMPEHRVMQALVSDRRDAFLRVEAEERQMAKMPPYARLAALIVSGPDQSEVDVVARELAKAAPRNEHVQVLGPAPAPLALLRGRHRRRLLFKARKDVHVQPLLRLWLDQVDIPNSVRVQVDVDPYSFL
ncbi:primosomal protein N' [Roseiterribacter gracilis]|uniref:primosomal protein N' n=1 Tax=Roseiterribacter gracilis TaxID=2812848 RepID=UPI003B43C9A6